MDTKNYEIKLDKTKDEPKKIPLELFRIANATILNTGENCYILLFNITEETRQHIVRLLKDVLPDIEKRLKAED